MYLLSCVLEWGICHFYVFVIILCAGVEYMPFLCVDHPMCRSLVYAVSVLLIVLCVGVGYMLSLCLLSSCVLEGSILHPPSFPLSLTLYTVPNTLSKSSWMKTCPNQTLRTYSPYVSYAIRCTDWICFLGCGFSFVVYGGTVKGVCGRDVSVLSASSVVWLESLCWGYLCIALVCCFWHLWSLMEAPT